MNIITDEKMVSKVVSNTIGVVPVFKFENKYYNEYEIEKMFNDGVDFNKKNNIIKTEEVVKVTSKLKNEDAIFIRKLSKMEYNRTELAKKFNVTKTTISNIRNNRTYKNI